MGLQKPRDGQPHHPRFDILRPGPLFEIIFPYRLMASLFIAILRFYASEMDAGEGCADAEDGHSVSISQNL
jgi:hypothetical protein